MQKSGVIKAGSHEADSDAIAEIKGHVEDIRRRSTISKYANKQPPAESRRKREVWKCIDDLFEHSERAQPSKIANIGASVADSTALVLSAATGNAMISLIVIPVSELIVLAKNFYDSRTASKLRKKDLADLESIRKDTVSGLANKSESAEMEKETNKLFSDIKQKSKEGMVTALGSRLEGFGGSVSALALGLTAFRPALDWASGMIDYLVLAQPIQPPGYPAPLISSTIKLITGGVAYVAGSFIASNLVDSAYNGLRRNYYTWTREPGKEELKERAAELLKKISKG